MPANPAQQYSMPQASQAPVAAATGGYPSYPGADAMAGMNAAAGAQGGAVNPAFQQMATMMPGMTPQQIQAMYQQYAMRWAAMQKFQADSQGGMGGPGMGGPGMGGPGMGMDPNAGMGGPGYGGAGYGQTGYGGAGYGQAGMQGPGGYGGPGGGDMGGGGGQFFKTRICGKFKDGACQYGDKCRYAHGEHELRVLGPDGQPMGSTVTPDKRAMINLMKKTRLCQEFVQTGACRYNEKCTFAHGQHELLEPPDLRNGIPPAAMATAAGQPIPRQALRKTKLCAKFMETGVCSYGERCTFAHGQHELRQMDDALPVEGANKRGRPADGANHTMVAMMAGGGVKKAHVEEEETFPAPSCPLCAQLVQIGKPKVLSSINALENPKAKQLGCMIMAASNRLDQLWSKCTPATVMGWLAKSVGLSIQDKIEVLKIVMFHAHGADGSRIAAGGLGLDSQKYVDMGLPAECADFVYVVMEGKEGNASMSEYFAVLEVCKALFGVNDDNYYTVSTAIAGIMMSM
eukprot:gene31723-6924_t